MRKSYVGGFPLYSGAFSGKMNFSDSEKKTLDEKTAF